jgi:hypothetical protein
VSDPAGDRAPDLLASGDPAVADVAHDLGVLHQLEQRLGVVLVKGAQDEALGLDGWDVDLHVAIIAEAVTPAPLPSAA